MRTNGIVDLHLHTTASDGVVPPAELVEMAHAAGVRTISITDHDSTEALPVAGQRASQLGVALIPGVEISATRERASVHILGYFIDADDAGLRERLVEFRDARAERARSIVELLHGIGVMITLERVHEIAGVAAIGRPHIAEAIVEAGYVDEFQQSFDRFIGVHAPAYVPRRDLAPESAIDMIRSAGGVAALAHPGTLQHDAWIPGFARAGLEGLEVWHPRHGPPRVQKYRAMAAELGLVATGGSDYHGGSRGESALGEQPVPDGVVEELAARVR